jgi:hypothetical protein
MILYVHRKDGGSIFPRNVSNKLPQSPKPGYLNTDPLSHETVKSYARVEQKIYLHLVLSVYIRNNVFFMLV